STHDTASTELSTLSLHDALPISGARDIERLVQHFGEIVDVAHQPVVLGARPGDANGVAFLERIVADQVRRHLTGDAHQRYRIHQDRKSTRLNSSHVKISYAVFCL